MCPCVRDGCGRDRNGFAGRVQKHHVRQLRVTEMVILNLSGAGDGKSCYAAGWDTLRC